MKLVLLIFVLIANCLGWVTVKVSVSGVVRCSKAFEYSVNMWDEDSSHHDLIGAIQHVKTSGPAEKAQQAGRFDIVGVASEQWPGDNEIEPRMTVEHTCGTEYACVCKAFPGTGVEFTTTVDFDLENLPSDVVYCDVCAYAKKRRERAGKHHGARLFGHYGGRG